MMADKGVILTYVFVVVAVTAIVALTMALGNRIRRQHKELDRLEGMIAEAQWQSEAYLSICDSTKRVIEQTGDYHKELIVELDIVKGKLANAKAALLSTNRQLGRARKEAADCGMYATAACALLEGTDIALEKFPLREVPYLAAGVDSLGLRHPAGYELKRKGFEKVGDLVKADPDSLLLIRGMGTAAMDSISRAIEENGCRFGMEYVRINDRYFTKD